MPNDQPSASPDVRPPAAQPSPEPTSVVPQTRTEVGGPPGPEPTRYGDWERNGRCVDF